jgi:3-(3-hydroxy-phenyl)propionate hydroxylase
VTAEQLPGPGPGGEVERLIDVLIVGAGPVGLTLANQLGGYGLSAMVVERGASLIDYPRGVGMDDESLRVFQAIGLVEEIRQHTTPDQYLRFLTAKGRCFASVEPRTREFGWPRRNAFIQPLIDKVLLQGTKRFPNVEVIFDRELTDFVEQSDHVRAQLRDNSGEIRNVHCRFIVGCDGGRSTVRKILNIAFEGKTDSTRWVVIDIKNDPLAIPDAYLHCIPSRPYVTMALPHGIRRCEFMALADETDEELCTPQGLRKLLGIVLPEPEAAEVIRARVYTHHARLAARFRVGRGLLAGDAAHLMPVWQGQGFNSGIRDANNIAWKLAAIVRGLAPESLLESYEQERRSHAAAMIAISVLVGRIFAPSSNVLAALRDTISLLLNAIPSAKSYITQMRFKPMPRYERGVVLHPNPDRATDKNSPVGRLFIQPRVGTSEGGTLMLDDALGDWFAILTWAIDPRGYLDHTSRAFWQKLNARFVTIVPHVQLKEMQRREGASDLMILSDVDQTLKDWFGRHRTSIVVLRPDRFVAAATTPIDFREVTRHFMTIFSNGQIKSPLLPSSAVFSTS